MITKNEHKEIPGNPSTAKSSIKKLRTEASDDSLRVLTIEDWKFWRNNGYIIIKNAVPREQAFEILGLTQSELLRNDMIQ